MDSSNRIYYRSLWSCSPSKWGYLSFTCLYLLLLIVMIGATQEKTQTVEFDVRPGGMVHSFSHNMGEHRCSFTYASQGGTNEQWQMSVGLSEDEGLFSCSVWRPQGKSYLFFTQFKAEVTGAKIEYASAYSQAAIGGTRDVPLKNEEYIIGDTTVTHREGKFRSELSKLTVIARTRHDEL
ncbi:myeloid-derived growth factor [Polypterus senegalus]|uniref:myeloid-derived growth factor n=1 Tax=Polypterus senegalus TaxID=55291 RepID=UPI0019626429|nr:myeloid-derived growth factor [Polypterus senegalus]